MRVMIALTVPDDADVNDLATTIDCAFGDQGVAPSSTVWKWDDFWQDVADDVVSLAADTTDPEPVVDDGERRCDECTDSYNLEDVGGEDGDEGLCPSCSVAAQAAADAELYEAGLL